MVLSFVLPPTTVAELGALLVYADSVQADGLHFSNLFDVLFVFAILCSLLRLLAMLIQEHYWLLFSFLDLSGYSLDIISTRW